MKKLFVLFAVVSAFAIQAVAADNLSISCYGKYDGPTGIGSATLQFGGPVVPNVNGGWTSYHKAEANLDFGVWYNNGQAMLLIQPVSSTNPRTLVGPVAKAQGSLSADNDLTTALTMPGEQQIGEAVIQGKPVHNAELNCTISQSN